MKGENGAAQPPGEAGVLRISCFSLFLKSISSYMRDCPGVK
jgi:hypothetical protein